MASTTSVPVRDSGTDANSTVHSSPGSNIEGLIESAQARSMATTEIRLGNKVAKPFSVEQSPTMSFMFSKPAATNSANEKKKPDQEKVIIPKRRTHPPDHSGILNTGSSSTRGASCQQEKIVKLSESQENSTALSIDTSRNHQSPALAPWNDVSSDPKKSLKASSPSRTGSLHPPTLGVDTSTLLKILAFSYHQETKQERQLISHLRSEYTNRAQELTAALTRCQRLEQSLIELQDQAETREKEIESLKQQLQFADTRSSANTDTNIERYLTSLDHKLDGLLQDRHKELGENAELGKALSIIRQMADELRQYRSQAQKPSPKKGINAAVQTSPRQDEAPSSKIQDILKPPQAQVSHEHEITIQSADKQHNDHAGITAKDRPCDLHQNRHHTEHVRAESVKAVQESEEHFQGPIAKPVELVSHDGITGLTLHGKNKFGKRANDGFSECSQTSERKRGKKANPSSSKSTRTPSKRVFLRSSSRSLSVTELNPSHSAPASNTDLSSNKAKLPRGPAGV